MSHTVSLLIDRDGGLVCSDCEIPDKFIRFAPGGATCFWGDEGKPKLGKSRFLVARPRGNAGGLLGMTAGECGATQAFLSQDFRGRILPGQKKMAEERPGGDGC